MTSALIKLLASSTGDRSGEQAGRNTSRQPAAATSARIRSGWCAPTLSTTITVPADSAGSSTFSR
nr:hypothetical protein [Geodermatophilus obscurus]